MGLKLNRENKKGESFPNGEKSAGKRKMKGKAGNIACKKIS
jgi:hypothetical protein